jgi:hypothetical protein
MHRVFITAVVCLISLSVFGQGMVNCSLLTVTDVIINNEELTIDVAVNNSDNMDAHYPYINYIIDSSGDTIQNGNLNLFVTFANETSWYNYSITSPITPLYPITIYFTYSNLTGKEPGDYTCELTYDISQNTSIDLTHKKTLYKIVNTLGREVNQNTNQILFYIYDDGSVEKKFVVE